MDRISYLNKIVQLRCRRFIKKWNKVEITIVIKWSDRKDGRFVGESHSKEIPLASLDNYIETQQDKLQKDFTNRNTKNHKSLI